MFGVIFVEEKYEKLDNISMDGLMWLLFIFLMLQFC